MKQALSMIWLVGLASVAVADLLVELRMENRAYLQHEAVMVHLSVLNDSDETVILSDELQAGYALVRFEVRAGTRGERTLDPLANRRFHRQVLIRPDERQELIMNLGRSHDLAEEGRYFVRCEILWNGRSYFSKDRMFDIVRGLQLVSVDRGLQGYDGIWRTYSLRYWTRERTEFLFLTVTELPSGMNRGVFALGPLVRITQPEISVSRRGDVVVRHQSGRNQFTMSYFESHGDGVSFVDQTFQLPNGTRYPESF